MKDNSSGSERTTATKRRRFAFSGIEQRALKRLRDLELQTGTSIVVGFSGGNDSLGLAAILARIAQAAQIIPHLVHVNHRLRPGSDQEADHAESLARSIGLPIRTVVFGSPAAATHPGVGVEEAARRERYRALATVAAEIGTNLIVTAHHQDDQAETVLLHLLRGSGLDGAAGMRALTRIDVPWWSEPSTAVLSILVWRPLLQEPKSEIEHYVATLGLVPNRDESNAALEYRRNAVRHDLLPAIEQVFPAARSALARFAEIAAPEDELVDSLATAALEQARTTDGTLSLDALLTQPEAVQRRIVLRWLRDLSGSSEVTLERVDAVLDMAQTGVEGPRVEAIGTCTVCVIGSELAAGTLTELEEIAWHSFKGPRIDLDVDLPVRLRLDQSCRIGLLEFRLESGGQPGGAEGIDWVRLPAQSAEDVLWLRRLDSADKFAQGNRRVRDWLRRYRVPVAIRRKLIGVAGPCGVLWIPGLPSPKAVGPEASPSDLVVSWAESQSPEG